MYKFVFREVREIRRRKKEEDNAATKAKVDEIRRKALEAEEHKRWKQSLYDRFMPFAVGAVLCLAGASYYMFKT